METRDFLCDLALSKWNSDRIQSIELFKRALSKQYVQGSKWETAQIMSNIGMGFSFLGRYEEAYSMIKKAIQLGLSNSQTIKEFNWLESKLKINYSDEQIQHIFRSSRLLKFQFNRLISDEVTLRMIGVVAVNNNKRILIKIVPSLDEKMATLSALSPTYTSDMYIGDDLDYLFILHYDDNKELNIIEVMRRDTNMLYRYLKE